MWCSGWPDRSAIGLLASLYAALARSAGGPVYALHVSGIVIAGVAGLGAAAAVALPAVANKSVWTVRPAVCPYGA